MKRALADVLWDAANVNLCANEGGSGCVLSCDAVGFTLGHSNLLTYTDTRRFLRSLGCNVEATDLLQEFTSGRQRQGVRYLWLLLAACVAEDEGLYV